MNETSRTVHIIDDNPEIRDLVEEAVKNEIQGLIDLKQPLKCNVYYRTYERIWYLTDKLTPAFVGAGDVLVCDLYPSGYWKERRKRPEPLVMRPPNDSDLLDNVMSVEMGVRDAIPTYLGKLMGSGRNVLVFTFVLEFLRINGHAEASTEIANALVKMGIERSHIIDKPSIDKNMTNMEKLEMQKIVAKRVAVLVMEFLQRDSGCRQG